jgi:threonine/homoserine/homoserine lactone efflux protein
MCKQGLLTALFNPKAAIFVHALFPQFINPNGGSLAIQIMVLATILNLIGLFMRALSFCSQSCQRIVH